MLRWGEVGRARAGIIAPQVSCPTNNSLAAPRLFAPGGVAPPRHSARYASSARLARHENPRADRASYWWDRTLGAFDFGANPALRQPRFDDRARLCMLGIAQNLAALDADDGITALQGCERTDGIQRAHQGQQPFAPRIECMPPCAMQPLIQVLQTQQLLLQACRRTHLRGSSRQPA